MTQEDKELLFKDLCARLPYHVKASYYGVEEERETWDEIECITLDGYVDIGQYSLPIEGIKPYLFSLSSMTGEMLEELNANGFFKYRDTIVNVSHIESKNGISKEIYTYIDIESISFLTEYFHSHHIDYRGLIEKSLALDATNLNIY